MPSNVFDIEYDHFSQFPMEHWRWKNFSPREIACKGTGKLKVNEHAMDCLQKLRDLMGVPLMLNSAYRSQEHNRRVGGAKNSYHLLARAFDISLVGHNAAKLEYMAMQAGFTGVGYYKRNNFLHFDNGPKRSWGTKWFNNYTPNEVVVDELEVEPPRQPETLAEDPVIRGIGAVVSGGALSSIADLVGNISPTVQLVGIMLIAAGVAYIIYKRL